jgi:antitoxin (DNA-binding transcriptional repressor) of toxin-antitoxin stability system
MPSVNIRQLRDTRQLEEWLEAGETVELRKRGRVFGIITPPDDKKQLQPTEWPDFAARRRAIFGDRVLNAVDDLIHDREESRS